MRIRTVLTLVSLVAAVGCNRESRGDKVNEATVANAAEPESPSGPSATMDPQAAAPPTAPTSESASSVVEAADAPEALAEPRLAQAELTAGKGKRVDGHARFIQQPDGVLVVLDIVGAPPGKKGVHVHTHGDCSDISGKSMGPHFAPKLEQHALPSEGTSHHPGDLGNITVAGDGKGHLEITVPAATLGSDESTSFLGRALVVHEGEDVGSGEQPAGGSGTPMACGVIHALGS